MNNATEKLLSNIHEYGNLLGFLKDKHPTVLDEWKSKSAGLAAQTQQPTDDSNHQRTNLNGNYTK